MAKNRGTDAQLLTLQELAAYLHLDEQTVGKLVTAGKIPSLQGLQFLAIGLAAVSLGRNPNGIAAALANIWPGIGERKRPTPPAGEPIREEARVVAPAG